jgi:Protein of unknown function (DUF3618)
MSTRTTGTDPGSKSAAELEREVQQSRADIEHTLGAIQERLSPGQLVDQALGYFRGGRGADFARNLGDSIAANPLPITLMGVGLAWMMFSSQRSARNGDHEGSPYWDERSPYWDEEPDPVEGHYGSFAEEDLSYLGPEADQGGGFGEGLKEAGRSATARMGEVGEQARQMGEAAREQARRAGERARDAGARARERVGRAGSGMAERAYDARARAGYYGRRARQGMLRSFEEQPLVLGAIGLAIGAALGAALPPTETEDELMGETRDKALRRATRAGREQAGKLREAASAVAAAARDEADRQGLTPESSGKPGEPTSTGSSGMAERRDEGRPAGFAGATQPVTDPKAGPDRT